MDPASARICSTPAGCAVAAGVRANGEGDIFTVDNNGTFGYMAYNGTAWSGPWPLSGMNFAPAGTPIATGYEWTGQLDAFTIDQSGALEIVWDGAGWLGPTPLTSNSFAYTGADLAAAANGSSELDVFLVNTTGAISVVWYDGANCQAPASISGAASALPGARTSAATQYGSSQLDLFAIGAKGLVRSVGAGSSWSAPVPMP